MKPSREPTSPPDGPTADRAQKESSAGPSMRSVASVGLFTFFSRLAGLVRVSTFAHFLGTERAADAFYVAFLLPNVLRRLVGEGAVSSAVVPVFARSVQRDDLKEQRVFAEKLLCLWLVLVCALTVAGILLAGWFVSLAFRWGSFDDPLKVDLTIRLTRILFWYLLLIGTAAALQGILNARKIFALPSLSPLLFNLVVVGFAWLVASRLPAHDQVYALAVGVLLGGLAQVGLMMPSIWRMGVRPRLRWPLNHGGVRLVLRLMVPATLGAGVYQINVVVATMIAARLEEGSVSALSYSNRVMEVVLGVFVFALSTVSLTSLSQQAAVADYGAFRSTLLQVLRLVIFITVPSAVGLYLLRRPILSLILEGGHFDKESLDRTIWAFQFHIVGITFVGVSRGLVSGFHALKDVATPVRVAAVNMFFHLALAWLLSSSPLRFAGVALASSLAAALQALLLAVLLLRKVESLSFGVLWGTAGKTVAAALIMGVLVWLARGVLPEDLGKLALAPILLVVISFAAAVFFAVASLLGMPEVRWLLEHKRTPSARTATGEGDEKD